MKTFKHDKEELWSVSAAERLMRYHEVWAATPEEMDRDAFNQAIHEAIQNILSARTHTTTYRLGGTNANV